MKKIDFKKTFKHLYALKTTDFQVVDVPTMNYLMIDGHGNPNTAQAYKDALGTLYPVAYKLKFLSKANSKDYVVPPLSGLWWADDMNSFTRDDKDAWKWTMMIMTPDWISTEMFTEALESVKAKNLPALDKLRLESLTEGTCVQIMHLGSYADEAPTLARLHEEWLPENGYTETGKHHEIYLSEPRKTPAHKLKTVLRQPIKEVSTREGNRT